MSIQAQNETWKIRGLGGFPYDKLILQMIANEADSDGLGAYPGVRRIAEHVEASPRTVLRGIARLEAAGLLLVKRPERRGPGRHNIYGLPYVSGQDPGALAGALGWPPPGLAPAGAKYGTLPDGTLDRPDDGTLPDFPEVGELADGNGDTVSPTPNTRASRKGAPGSTGITRELVTPRVNRPVFLDVPIADVVDFDPSGADAAGETHAAPPAPDPVGDGLELAAQVLDDTDELLDDEPTLATPAALDSLAEARAAMDRLRQKRARHHEATDAARRSRRPLPARPSVGSGPVRLGDLLGPTDLGALASAEEVDTGGRL